MSNFLGHLQLKEMIKVTVRNGRTVMAMAVLSKSKSIVDTISAAAKNLLSPNEVRHIL